jgi:superkiller protein 3
MIKSILTGCLALLISSVLFAQDTEPPSARSHFDEGLRLLRERSYEPALKEFEKGLALDPTQPASYLNIAAILIELRQYDKAEAAIRNAIKIAPTEGLFHSELCRVLSLQKKHAAALEACDEGVRLNPEFDRTHAARLIAMRQSGRDLETLQKNIDAVVGQFRNSELILVFASDHHMLSGNFAYAATLLESLITMRPDVSRFHGILAEVYLRLGRDADALTSARTALRLEPLNPYANYAMGLIFFELGQHDEAVDSFSKVRVDDPRLDIAGYYLAVSESRRGRMAEAIKVLRDLIAIHPDRPEFHYELARNLSTLHRYDEAQPVYFQANVLKPKDVEIVTGLAMTHMMLGQFEKAIPLFEEGLRLKPGNEHYQMFLNVSRGRQKLLPQIPSMIRKVDSDPKNIEMLLDLISALSYANRADETSIYVERVYQLDPNDELVYHTIGVAYSEAGRHERAIDAYKRSLAKKENPSAYLGLAGTYKQRGEFENASANFAKVLELKPDSPNIMKLYADLLRENGKRHEALEMYKRSLGLLPLNGPALLQAGLLSLKFGDRNAANNYLETLRTVDPELAKLLSRCITLRIWG